MESFIYSEQISETMCDKLVKFYEDNPDRYVSDKYCYGKTSSEIILNREDAIYKEYDENDGRDECKKRHLVFMTYLNTVKNAGTEFKYQKLKTNAVKGKTVIWPAAWTHTHKGIVSDKKEKIIITGWFSFV